MKTKFMFIIALILGGLILYTSATAQGVTVKVGTMYMVTDSMGQKSFHEVWDASCPVPANIYVHDTLYEVPGGYSSVRPLVPPVPAHDTIIIIKHDTVIVAPAPPLLTSIFTTQTPPTTNFNDGTSIELGVKFRSSQAGFILGIRFYKTSGNSGTHIGELYSSSGSRLGAATFTGETATGWQTVAFATPIPIVANTTYVAAYFSPTGTYISTANGFATSVTNTPLSALANGTDGINGIYKYSAAPAFPTATYAGHSPNYWVDVVFSTTP